MAQVELNDMYINMGANNAVKSYKQKNTAISGKLIKAVYVLYVYVYIFVQVSQVGYSIIPYLLD